MGKERGREREIIAVVGGDKKGNSGQREKEIVVAERESWGKWNELKREGKGKASWREEEEESRRGKRGKKIVRVVEERK